MMQFPNEQNIIQPDTNKHSKLQLLITPAKRVDLTAKVAICIAYHSKNLCVHAFDEQQKSAYC